MKKIGNDKETPLTTPVENDENFLKRLEYEALLDKASIWLHKLIIHRIRDLDHISAWYIDPTQPRPEVLASEMFNQEDQRFCTRFRYYCAMTLKYRQGDAPDFIIKRDRRIALILLSRLERILPNTETIHLVRGRIEEYCMLVTTRDGKRILRENYEQRIFAIFDQIVTLFSRLCSELRLRERAIAGEISPVATKADVTAVKAAVKEDISAIRKTTDKTDRKMDIVIAKQEETRKTVNRLDKRDKRAKKNARRRFSVEVQESVNGYWERGQENETLRREAGHHRVTHELVFNYYKSELMALGIMSAKDLKDCLGARSDRIRRSKKR